MVVIIERWYNIYCFIDVDGTLIDYNDNPRPYVVEFFSRLRVLGCTVVVWSAGGVDYAERKLNMIANKFDWQGLTDIRPLVHIYLGKDDWIATVKNIKGKQFYVDDEPGLLEAASDRGYGTFKVPFYDNSDSDDWLLRALTTIERAMDEEVYRSSNLDDGDQSEDTQEGVVEGEGGSSDEASDSSARDRLKRISNSFLEGPEDQTD